MALNLCVSDAIEPMHKDSSRSFSSCHLYLLPPPYTNYVSQFLDPQARPLTFNYTTNGGVVLLVSMVDYDNRTNFFLYDSVFTNQISTVVDAYNRTNRFVYNS